MKNCVWEAVLIHVDKLVMGSRWMFKVKHIVDGSIEKYKAIFLAKGFSQVEGIDYEVTFAFVGRYSSIRSILALIVQMGWKILQMDVQHFSIVLLRRRCTSNNQKVLRHLIGSLMRANSSKYCMVSNMHPVLCTPRSTIISLVWASPKVKQMRTSIIFW